MRRSGRRLHSWWELVAVLSADIPVLSLLKTLISQISVLLGCEGFKVFGGRLNVFSPLIIWLVSTTGHSIKGWTRHLLLQLLKCSYIRCVLSLGSGSRGTTLLLEKLHHVKVLVEGEDSIVLAMSR